MTQPPAVCPGGSQPNSLAPLNNFLTGQALTKLFGLIFPESAFLDLLAVAAGYAIDTNSICAHDPPAMPVWDGTVDFVFPPIFPFLSDSGFSKLGTMVQIAAWYTYCECKTGTTPAAPVAPPYPPQAPIIQPPSIPGPGSAPCFNNNNQVTIHPATGVGVFTMFPDLTLLPGTWTQRASWQASGYLSYLYPIPAGASSYDFVVTGQGTIPGPNTNMVFWDSNLRGTGRCTANFNTINPPFYDSLPAKAAIPANSAFFSLDISPSFDSGAFQTTTWVIQQQLQLFCGTTALPPESNCCSDLLFRLQNILQLLENLKLAGAGGLFAYVDSTRHSGLSGDGTITIQTKAVAFRVEVTSNLTNWPHHPQIPTYFFSLGFMTSYALQSPIKGWRLVYQSQTYPLGAECDQIGFQLPPGVIADVVELLAAAG